MSDAKLSAMIPKGRPFEFEGLDVRPGFRANDGGAHTYSANFMVTEEMWNLIKTIPRHRMIKGILLWYEDDAELETAPEVEKPHEPAQPLPLPGPEPRTKGPWSAFWQQLYKQGFQNIPALLKELKVNGMGESVKLAIRDRFHEDSLTKISPDRFQTWLATKRLTEVQALSEQALGKLGGAEYYKWDKGEFKEDAA